MHILLLCVLAAHLINIESFLKPDSSIYWIQKTFAPGGATFAPAGVATSFFYPIYTTPIIIHFCKLVFTASKLEQIFFTPLRSYFAVNYAVVYYGRLS